MKPGQVIRGTSDLELEMDHLYFAKCLTELSDSQYIQDFQELLVFSFEIRTEEKFYAYSDYVQRIVHDYYGNLEPNNNYLHELRTLVEKYPNAVIASTFKAKLRDLEVLYIGEHKTSIRQSINQYNLLQTKFYEPINSSEELMQIIRQVIRNEVTNEIKNGGLYRPIRELAEGRKTKSGKTYRYPNEDLIQKTLKLLIENNLSRKGFRDVDIIREPELYDGKRYDYLIKYGFIGPVTVEIKLENNREITNKTERTDYKRKLQQYLDANNGHPGLYLVFKLKKSKANEKHYHEMINEYSDIKNLHIERIDCSQSPVDRYAWIKNLFSSVRRPGKIAEGA